MSYTFTANVPLAAQRISATTSIINNNFQALNTYLQNDHVDINDATLANRLTHSQVTLNNLGSGPTTSSSQLAIYTKTVTAGVQELFIRRQSDGTEIQMSATNITPSATQTFLPGNLLMVFGNGNVVGAAPQNFSVPGMSTIYAFVAIKNSSGGSAISYTNTLPAAFITLSYTSLNPDFSYIAIGEPA